MYAIRSPVDGVADGRRARGAAAAADERRTSSAHSPCSIGRRRRRLRRQRGYCTRPYPTFFARSTNILHYNIINIIITTTTRSVRYNTFIKLARRPESYLYIYYNIIIIIVRSRVVSLLFSQRRAGARPFSCSSCHRDDGASSRCILQRRRRMHCDSSALYNTYAYKINIHIYIYIYIYV